VPIRVTPEESWDDLGDYNDDNSEGSRFDFDSTGPSTIPTDSGPGRSNPDLEIVEMKQVGPPSEATIIGNSSTLPHPAINRMARNVRSP
jgi:hypothetical protein